MKVAVAPVELEDVLAEELGSRLIQRHGRLMVFEGPDPIWAQNIWLDSQSFELGSISQAVNHLRSLQRNWWLHSTAAHRRAALIREQLPPLKPKPYPFLAKLPASPLGSFTLLDEKTMLYSARCSSLFPDGEIEFFENKKDPPSRAYLKLWELFTTENVHPREGEKVLDLGASPGGWTWVLDQLRCDVISVDKAPLANELKISSRVKFIESSAFALEPKMIGKVDWLFSDIICYPERLFELVRKWEPFARNMVCTIKFQGETDHSVTAQFLGISDSKLRHLSHNKHELTWWLLR